MNKIIDITGVAIKTERLYLRPFEEGDLADFYEYARVDGVGQMAGWQPHESIEKSREILNRFIAEKKTFAIVYNNKVIGSLGIERYNEKHIPQFDSLQGREIGYVLSKDYWGQGIMPEAVRGVIDWLFSKVKLDFITVAHFEWNNQSKRVIEKCGFSYLKDIDYETRLGTVERSRLYVMSKE